MPARNTVSVARSPVTAINSGPASATTFVGHIDFYGADAAAGGWFLDGWSSRWPTEPDKLKMILNFEG